MTVWACVSLRWVETVEQAATQKDRFLPITKEEYKVNEDWATYDIYRLIMWGRSWRQVSDFSRMSKTWWFSDTDTEGRQCQMYHYTRFTEPCLLLHFAVFPTQTSYWLIDVLSWKESCCNLRMFVQHFITQLCNVYTTASLQTENIFALRWIPWSKRTLCLFSFRLDFSVFSSQSSWGFSFGIHNKQ